MPELPTDHVDKNVGFAKEAVEESPMKSSRPFYRSQAFQMLVALVLGGAVGYVWPSFGTGLNALAVGFIKLITMIVALLIFLTISVGIARLGSVKTVGRIGIKLIVYFEVVSTIALLWGLMWMDLFRPGAGMNINPSTLDSSITAGFASSAHSMSIVTFLLNVIPSTAMGAFAQGSILQVLVFSVFVGFALLYMGKRAELLLTFMQQGTEVIFFIVGAVMKVAPLAVFGAMAYTIGRFGLGSVVSLGKVIGLFYLSCIAFIIVVMGVVSVIFRFNLWKFARYIREEMLLAFCTASSEAVLPRMFAKLENAGCAPSVVGLTIPTGYSFNLDGSSLYLTTAALFIAQATNVHLGLGQEFGLLVIFLLSSKGVAGVTAGGFVVLAGTLTVFPDIPLSGLALILGIDRFFDAMRTMTNVLGNGVATLAIAKWENQRDDARMHKVLDGDFGMLETPQPLAGKA